MEDSEDGWLWISGAQRSFLQFARSKEFKAMELGRHRWSQHPGKILKALLHTGAWKKHPTLFKAAAHTASKLAINKSIQLATSVSAITVFTVVFAIVFYRLLPEPEQAKLRRIIKSQLKPLHLHSNNLLSFQMNHGDGSPQKKENLAGFIVRWNDHYLYSLNSNHKTQLPFTINTIVPALGKHLRSIERTFSNYYQLPIQGYCLPGDKKDSRLQNEEYLPSSASLHSITQPIGQKCYPYD